MKNKLIIAAAAFALAAGGGAAIAGATGGGDDDDRDGQVRDRSVAASAGDAALKAAGGGQVTEVERADEGASGYEVEVRRSDGSYVEVALDDEFGVVSVERDDD